MNTKTIAAMRFRPILPVLCVLLAAGCGSDGSPAYKNPALSPEKRAEDLLGRMTLEEKVGQLLCPLGWPMYEKRQDGEAALTTVSDAYRRFVQEQHGGMLWATFRADPWTQKTLETGLDPVLAAKTCNALQRYAVDSTRLGIPMILAEEGPHGHMAIGTTVFPTGIGLASTWSRETLRGTGRVIADELRAQGAHISYGPVIDIAREPRWSRVEETFGEDVFLTGELAAAETEGLAPRGRGWEEGVVVTPKHFIAYGIPEGGHNGNPSFTGPRDLHEHFLPAFEKVLAAGALSVMTSYNAIDGVPTTASRDMLTGVLRDRWGFEGFVVSDLQSIDVLCTGHHIAADRAEAAELALRAGVDVDLGANCYPHLIESVRSGRIDESLVDDAVRRVLLLKFRLGLFDHPYIDENAAATVRSADHVAVAARAARESVTLLENKGILPLREGMKVAVVGPNADAMYNQLGDYTAPQRREDIVTPLDGIRARAGAANVRYARGCAVRDVSRHDIPAAVAAARASDVVIAVVGGSSARDFKTSYLSTGAAVVDETTVSDMEAGEGYDRASLGLLGLQDELLQALKRSGKPLVVVYIEGRPLDKRWAAENADALLTLWYPGQEGGTALAEVLWGDYNPAGRLPVSVPRDAGQLPVYYNKRFPRGGDYVEMGADPLYPFGHGLSYSRFEYGPLELRSAGPDSAEVSLSVRNCSERDGDEVVQLYITDVVASTVRPRKQLCAFERIHIPAGESRSVTFRLGPEAFALYDSRMEKTVEPGDFILAAGASSADIRQTVKLTLP